MSMNRKNLRHFFCGLLIGAGGMYWYVVSSEDTLDWVMGGLQRAADEYRATHPTSEADSGWRPRRAEGQ